MDANKHIKTWMSEAGIRITGTVRADKPEGFVQIEIYGDYFPPNSVPDLAAWLADALNQKLGFKAFVDERHEAKTLQ